MIDGVVLSDTETSVENVLNDTKMSVEIDTGSSVDCHENVSLLASKMSVTVTVRDEFRWTPVQVQV